MPTLADPDAGGVDDAALQHWLDDLKANAAVRSRARRPWLVRQAAGEQTVLGLLSDLRDARHPMVVETVAPARHRGLVHVVGPDVVVVRTDQGADVVVPLVAVAGVRLGPAGARATGGPARRSRSEARLMTVLGALADAEAPVVTRPRGGNEPLRGRLEAVGSQIITVRLEGRGGLAYVPVTSLAEVSVLESG
jgi:hypothetical protein